MKPGCSSSFWRGKEETENYLVRFAQRGINNDLNGNNGTRRQAETAFPRSAKVITFAK